MSNPNNAVELQKHFAGYLSMHGGSATKKLMETAKGQTTIVGKGDESTSKTGLKASATNIGNEKD